MKCARNLCELLISSVPGGSLFLSVCMCVHAFMCMHDHIRTLLATALFFIQVDSKFILPDPLALETYCKKVK